jgi:hypothetical protein
VRRIAAAVAQQGGKARAVLRRIASIATGVSAGCADSISATVPDTSGAEKLVPSDALKLSV